MNDSKASSLVGWISVGVGVIGIGFTLRPPTHISPVVFGSILLVGIVAVAFGARAIVSDKAQRLTSVDTPSPTSKKHLLAIECDRFSDALSDFLGEQSSQKPRAFLFGNGAGRLRQWQERLESRYRQEFRPWGLEIFDAAVRLDGVDVSSRVFVASPSPTQLDQLPDLFRDAARSLKRDR